MKSRIFLLCSSLLFCMAFLACNSTKNLQQLVYLQDSTTADNLIVQNIEPTIQPGDRLSITVSAFNPASAAPYNIGGGLQGIDATTGSATSMATVNPGYLVKPDGSIQFPQFGRLEIAGKTLQQLNTTLTGMLQKFVTDPIVTINFLNYKVTVLGEVNRPGPIPAPDGNLTIIEAVGIAGDLTIFGKRDNILVIREQNGKREFGRVNLLSKNIFNSPYYKLQQNDVVYVEMTKAKAADSDQSTTRNITLATSIITVISTLTLVIINLTR
ncbi:MAG: polysaccharide export protein [Chitinophagaceae bacterium]|nr:polysaccharide export protein [Chitinophagaceae bacterium]